MKLRSSRLLGSLLGSLTACAIVVACGSDDSKKHVQGDEAGAGGQLAAAGGGKSEPDPVGGAGGMPPVALGGVAGEAAAGMAGAAPMVEEGGAAGAAGAPAMLPELPAVNCDTITFEDVSLENVVRSEIGKFTGDITPADVATLTDLFASDAGIIDLTGIECLTALENADFGGGEAPNQIADVSPLRYLSALKRLDLSANPVADLSPLVYLTELAGLDLTYNNEPDLTPLATLPALKVLSIEQATFAVPASLATLKNIKELYASYTAVDGNVVGSLTQLTHLELAYTALEHPEGLGNLGNLGYLDAIDLGLTSAAPFASMTELTHLSLRENDITDIGPLQNLTGLSDLSLFATPLSTLLPLVNNQGLSNGDTVDLSNVSTLDCATEQANVTTLEGRGVTITGNPCP